MIKKLRIIGRIVEFYLYIVLNILHKYGIISAIYDIYLVIKTKVGSESVVISISLALILAKFKHYSLKPLLKAYALYPFFLIEIFYWIMQITIFTGNYSYIKYASYVKSAYLYILIIPIIIYQLYTPALFGSASILIGTGLNRLVMHVNCGKMPVFPSLSIYTGYYNEGATSSADSIHCIGTASAHLKILCDYIDVGWCILSIGDLFVHAFTVIIIFYTIKKLNINLFIE